MDKLYLRVIVAIDMWRHEDQLETFLFDELACEENLLETRELLSVIDKAAIEMKNYSVKNNQDLYREAEKLYRLKDFNSFWEYSHKIVRNMPIDSPELRKMLILRAKAFCDYGYTDNAIQDYEICVYMGQQNNTLYLEELAHLIECYYDTGEYERFEQSFSLFRKEYNRELKIARSKRSMKKNSSRLAVIKQYEDKIRKFESMNKTFRNKLHSKYLGETKDERKFKPFNGFKGALDERISSASVACTVISKEKNGKKHEKIVANRPIPLGEIIAFERPLDREFYTPMLQCEFCFQLTTILYTCFNCHQKYYCRLECLKSDTNMHQYECNGLRNGLLYSMEATMLFRLLIKCLSYLKTYVFCKYSKAPDINDFFELIIDNIKYGPQAKIKKLMMNFDNYETVDYSEIFSMATYALRIAVYAVEKTSILEDFFINVQFEKHDLLIFIASLLLRLQNQMKVNSVEFGYIIVHPENISNIEVKPYQSEIFHSKFSRRNDSQTIFEYCNYSKEEASDEARQLISTYVNEAKVKDDIIRHKDIQLPVKVTRKFMNQAYLDNICGAEHEFNLEQKLNIAFRATKEILHLRMHTFNSNLSDGTSAVTMQGVYPTITKFKHSCESNAVPILLESGSLIIKAGRNIAQGEEITLSYIAEYKCHSNVVRKHLQSYLKFRCNCKFCTNDIDYWELNNTVICFKCHKVIFGTKCEGCNVDKFKTSSLYDEICKSVRNTATRTVEEKNEIKTLKYLILLYQIQTLMYPESHHSTFISKLEFAITCVQKNFVYDAYELLRKFFYQIPVALTEWNFQHLVYLSMILDKLICILNGNVCHNKNFVRLNFDLFYDIWNLANEVAKKLIFQHDFFEIFNFTTYSVLTQYQLLIQIKFVLFDFEYDNLKKPIFDKDKEYEMPGLSVDDVIDNLNNHLRLLSSVREYEIECFSDSDTEQISFFVKGEDLVPIPSLTKLVDSKDSINVDYSFNFISPDMTGNDNVIEETELKTMIETNLTFKEGESFNITTTFTEKVFISEAKDNSNVASRSEYRKESSI